MLKVEEHPSLCLLHFRASLPAPLGELSTPERVLEGLKAPPSDRLDTTKTIRSMIRFGGFKPSGRNKPAWEYLDKAAAEGRLGSINPVVDLGNLVSLHHGFPISVVDFDLLEGDISCRLGREGESYVFNPSGQVLDLKGLISLGDGQGLCAGPIKDSQRTKTHDGTRETLNLIWGEHSLAEETRAADEHLRELYRLLGAEIR